MLFWHAYTKSKIRLQNAAPESAADAAARATAAAIRPWERAHEWAFREVEVTYPHIVEQPPAREFRLDATVKFNHKFDENNVNEHLSVLEKICEVNDWPRDKYASSRGCLLWDINEKILLLLVLK